MSSGESHDGSRLVDRLRKIMATVVDPKELLEEQHTMTGFGNSVEDVIQVVVEKIGSDSHDWQSHEFIEPLRDACRACGLEEWAQEFDHLVCYSADQLVPGTLMEAMTRHLTDFGHPRQLETFFSRSILSQNWPVHDGLNPTEPFRFLCRRVQMNSILGEKDIVESVGSELIREIDWVSGEVQVAGVLDGPLEVSFEEAWSRWTRLRERIRGFLEATPSGPKVRWEIVVTGRPAPGFLFEESGREEWIEDFIHACSSGSGTAELILRVPDMIPVSLRPCLSRALRSASPPVLISIDAPRKPIVAGQLPADPDVLPVLAQRTRCFDLILEMGGDPPWRTDWLEIRAAAAPIWWAREFDFPRSSIDYMGRNFPDLESLPVIALESIIVERGRRDLKRLLDRISRRRGGGWDRLGELLRVTGQPPKVLQSSGDRTL